MKAVAYLRVSSLSQVEGHSLDAQERLFRELCKSRGWEAAAIYREEGKSALSDSLTKRPELRRLLEEARGRQFQVVVVHTMDRLARNLRVLLEVVSTLGKDQVALASITEQVDWSTPEGRLVGQSLGSVAEFFSRMLARHVEKGVQERVHKGLHLGSIPFGYASCWEERDGEKRRRCNPEHAGGIHPVAGETEAVQHLFATYMSGRTTLARLAAWMNAQGFRTRNTKALPDAAGNRVAGPQLFTTASVRGILHNAFYAGMVRHRERLAPGIHAALITRETFDLVQDALRRNSGRSMTLTTHPQRHYLLKGLVRCIHCGMPMWAQTYANGQRYYREHAESRSLGHCPAAGGSVACDLADAHVGDVIANLSLPDDWLAQVLAKIALTDEVERVKAQRQQVQEKLRRTALAHIDLLLTDAQYRQIKRNLEFELEGLVVPQANAAEEAGRLVQGLPELWARASAEERRKLLLTVLDAVYVDGRAKTVVSVRPKPPFRPLFELGATSTGVDVSKLSLDAGTGRRLAMPSPKRVSSRPESECAI